MSLVLDMTCCQKLKVSATRLSDTLYETTPKWHGFLMIKLAALAAGLNSEPQNFE